MPRWCCELNEEFRETLDSFDKSYSDISKACHFMIENLNKLKVKAEKLKDKRLIENIEETLNHFDFCNDFATDIIPKSEWEDYDFDGDLLGLFNDYLSEFWDICDYVVNDKDRYDVGVQKFCWVKL